MIKKRLLLAGGLFNAVVGLLHIILGYQIFRQDSITPVFQSMMLMLNIGCAVFLFFIAYVSLFLMDDIMKTKIGKSFLISVLIFYCIRIIEEIVISPKFSPAVFGSCAVIGIIYLLVLLLPVKVFSEKEPVQSNIV